MTKIFDFFKKNTDISIIIIVGTLLRVRELTRYEMWFDEAYTGILMHAPRDIFINELQRDVHPPLFNLLMKGWTTLVGTNDVTLRLLPALFGIATIYLTYLAAKKLFNKETGLFAAIFVAISPFLIGYSAEARSYSFYGFLAILALVFFAYKKWTLFFASLAGMLFTHYISVMFIVPFLGFYAITKFYNREKFTWGEVVAGLLFVGILLREVYGLMRQAGNGLNMDWIRDTSILNIPRSFMAYLFGVKVKMTGEDAVNNVNFYLNEYIWGGLILVGLAVLVGYFLYKYVYLERTLDNSKLNALFVMLAVLLPQVLLITTSVWFDKKIYVERYLLPAAIFFFIALAYLLYKSLTFEMNFFVIIFYILLLTSIQTPHYYSGMRETANRLASFGNEIIFVSPIDFTVARYYFLTYTPRTYETQGNLRLYDFTNPENKYIGWPFIYEDLSPQDFEQSIIVSPDENRVPQDYTHAEVTYDLGNYKIYQRR
jgi:uncharacterized membrane protein